MALAASTWFSEKRVVGEWLPHKDSNLNKQIQNLRCYHYTMRQSGESGGYYSKSAAGLQVERLFFARGLDAVPRIDVHLADLRVAVEILKDFTLGENLGVDCDE